MKLCQTLYEAGYITYMRTDSSKYCDEFISSIKDYILKKYNNEKFINKDIDFLSNSNNQDIKKVEEERNPPKKNKQTKTNKKSICVPLPQEAHEAIRPTNIFLEEISDKATSKEKKLYKIIWQRAIESCMSSSESSQIISKISAPDNNSYSFSSELIIFLGWKIVNPKNIKELDKMSKEYNYLQSIKQDQEIIYQKINSSLTLKDLKNHIGESKLVQLLEEKGIGRPSTFSMLVDKIQEREYVKKLDVEGKEIECIDFSLENKTIQRILNKKTFGNEKGKLIIQPLGVLVIEFLLNHFSNIFDYEYTKQMEDELDKISKGEKIWYELCDQCYKEIDNTIKSSSFENKKKEIKIDETHSYIIGKNGPVIKCAIKNLEGKIKVTFKPVKKDIDIKKLENGEYKIDEIIDKSNIIIGEYKDCPLILRKGKYGLYASWGDNTKNLSCFGNRPMENIRFEDVKEILDNDSNISTNNNFNVNDNTNNPEDQNKKKSNIIRKVSNNISIRNGKYGDYIFYKSQKMTKPMFLKIGGFKGDYKTCHDEILQNWIKEEYGFF
jgi:DNA topoisomerase-1